MVCESFEDGPQGGIICVSPYGPVCKLGVKNIGIWFAWGQAKF